jgi:hypothetical protein
MIFVQALVLGFIRHGGEQMVCQIFAQVRVVEKSTKFVTELVGCHQG